MKKRKYVVLLVMTMVLFVCLFGCNGDDSENQNTSENDNVSIDTNTEEGKTEQEDLSLSTGFSTEYTVEDAKDGYFIVSKLNGTLYGLLDSYGREVMPVENDKMIFPESEEARAVMVSTEGKAGVYDYNGNEIIPIGNNQISNYGKNSKLYLVQQDGIQRIVGLDGTEQKELKGTYDYIWNDLFLVDGYNSDAKCADTVYNLDEELLYECDTESEYVDIDLTDDIEGWVKLWPSNEAPIRAALMDTSGKIIFTSTECGPTDWDIESLQDDQLFRIHGENYKFYNLATKTVSEQEYSEIVRADDNTILATRLDGDVDVYNMNGELEKTLDLSAENLIIAKGSSIIVAQYGGTYRIYNKDGEELSDERYLGATPVENYWMIINLDGQYGLMDNTGSMCIEFGLIGENTYEGKEWKNTYVFDDRFCIITENAEGSNVWIF